MLKMTLFYGKIRVLSSNKMVNSAAVFTLAAIVLASTFASVNGQDSRVTTWGSLGSAPGQFDDLAGMTVQYPSGNVFVADTGNSRIQEFDNNGKFIKQINAGTQFDSSDNIDLDVDSNGKIYLTDRNDDNIIIFSP